MGGGVVVIVVVNKVKNVGLGHYNHLRKDKA